jgi:hypothetical protein
MLYASRSCVYAIHITYIDALLVHVVAVAMRNATIHTYSTQYTVQCMYVCCMNRTLCCIAP